MKSKMQNIEEVREMTGNCALAKPVNSLLNIVILAVWFGLLTGLGEGVFLVGWRHYFRASRIFVSEHALWMAPLSEALIFVFVGGVLTLLAWRLPRFFTTRLITFVYSILAVLALFLLLPQLHMYAKWILAAGIAFQLSRLIATHDRGFFRLVRGTLPVLVAAVFGLAIAVFVWEEWSESKALAALPPASSGAPNVIIITLDTVRAKSLSLYGYERRTTPQLEQLAKDGVVFEQAIATASWTLPSHASIFTGRNPNELSAGHSRPLDNSHNILAEELGDLGYESAGFVANYLYCSKETGIGRGMIRYEDHPISLGQTILSGSLGQEVSSNGFVRRALSYHDNLNRKSAEELNDDFLNWLSSRDGSRPFFAFLNYFDAHEPLLPPAPFDRRWGSTQPNGEYHYYPTTIALSEKHGWSKEESEIFRNSYDSSIAYLDHHLGVLFSKLSESGMIDNTLVIITSDHGESLGERGLYSHGLSLYVETLRVPLLMRFPSRVPGGSRIKQPVSLSEIPSTVLDLIGEENTQSPFPTESLGRYLDGTDRDINTTKKVKIFSEIVQVAWEYPWYPAFKGSMNSLISEQYHYISNENGEEELYDRKTDPGELRNLANSPEMKEVMDDFRSGLKDVVKKANS